MGIQNQEFLNQVPTLLVSLLGTLQLYKEAWYPQLRVSPEYLPGTSSLRGLVIMICPSAAAFNWKHLLCRLLACWHAGFYRRKGLQSYSYVVLTCFLTWEYNILPKKGTTSESPSTKLQGSWQDTGSAPFRRRRRKAHPRAWVSPKDLDPPMYL